MARRRKSTGNSKSKTESRNTPSEANNVQGKEENCVGSDASSCSSKQKQPGSEENCSSDTTNDTNTNNDQSQNNLMPLDIQQMILGDLKNVGRADEIIVSREEPGDPSEDTGEFLCETEAVVETTRLEEYEIHTEEDEEEELVLMNEDDDGEENQYVILINNTSGEGFEVNDDTSQEFVSIHNLADLQEGSCEIITVVRESDYDSSQESVEGEYGEHNINAVIGTLDGIHCVNFSQYQSDDESSNHDESLENQEIQVIEHETEINILTNDNMNMNDENQEINIIEIPNEVDPSCVENEENKVESFKDSPGPCQTYCEIVSEKNMIVETKMEVDEINNCEIGRSKESTMELTNNCKDDSLTNSLSTLQTTESIPKSESSLSECDQEKHDNNVNISLESKVKSELISDITVNKENKAIDKETKTVKSELISDITGNKENKAIDKENKTVKSELISDITVNKENKAIDKETKTVKSELISDITVIKENKAIDKETKTPDSRYNKNKETRRGRSKSKASLNSSSIKVDSEKEMPSEKGESEPTLDGKNLFGNIQEQKVTSNCSASENVSFENSPLDSLDSTIPKKENVTSSSNEYCLSQTPSDKSDSKNDLMKEESVPREEDDKQSAFRSRSGSTDTTGSEESGSNSGSSRRRSGRIRSIGISKHCELGAKSTSLSSVSTVTSTTTPPVPGYEPDKPVKVKSRWRRSSELEMGSSNRRQQELEVLHANVRLPEVVENVATPPPSRPPQPTTPPDSPPADKEVEDVLAQFERLDCNEYHTERLKSKEAKRMVCDCTLTKEEMARGDLGCGEDCLNRLLMIECGARCMLGERCANKRFQNLEYAKCEVFKTELKGFGLRALEDIPEDTFLLEYVGEVLDPKEFRRRAKDYAKDKNQHFYFMALKSDSIIDATQKGNISRFINHSCDPNAETQKWTVNGELRVGFFSKRQITAGEEITFDYQLQRYGKEAQRCHCQTAVCRGWIGEDPEKENKWSDISGKSKERKEKEKKKKEDKRKEKDMLNDIDLEEEIEKLVLKNRAQTLLLCRLMVRAEDHSSRAQLLNILRLGETACLRLFLDYHGLRLIWSWMMDPATDSRLKIEILETLAKLPIQNKTMLQDSKVLSVVEKWSTSGLNVAEAKDRSSTEDESDKGDVEKLTKGSESEKNSDDSNQSKPLEETEEQKEINRKKIVELANSLLHEWASLKEVFRIPKKERIEQMKEHEREADRLVRRDSSVEKQDKSYDRHWSRNDYDRREKDKDRKRGRGDSPDSDKSRKAAKIDDRQSHLSKLERRQLFAIKAAQEEEERLRRQQENMWQEQVQLAAQELAAQQQANNFVPPGFPPHQWLPYPPPDGNMLPQQHMEGQPMFGPGQHPPFPFNQNGPHPPFLDTNQHPPFLDTNQHPPFLDTNQHPPFLDPNHNSPFHNMFSHPPPLPKQPLLPTPNHQPLLTNPPLPNQPFIATPNQPLLSNPPLPSQPFIPQPNQPMLPTPPLPNQPQPMNLPPFSQPPLPNHPPPLPTTQPPTSMSYPVLEVSAPQKFQTVPQPQFSQPPPFTSPPPLPTQAPAPNPLPVFQASLPAQFPTSAVVPVTTAAASPVPLYLPVKLPPKWKSAKDAEGRTYYYHVKTRVPQWEPPIWDYQQQQTIVQESESESESSDSEDEDSSSPDEKEEEDKNEEEVEQVQSLNDDDLGCEELADSPYEPETMELLEDIEEDPKKKRRDVLVQERIISPRTEDEIPDKLDKKRIRELKEKLRRQKSKEKLRQKQKNKSKSRSGTSKCEADTSSDPGRKIKDAFRLNMAGVIVHYLNAYRKPDCKMGKITNTEDFKHLARKLTHFVMLKELKHCRSVDELVCNDNVKHKARDFIKKYMSKFGTVYYRPDDD